MLYLDFIIYMVSYVSDLIMDWPERIFSTISHPIFNQASRDHPKYIGTYVVEQEDQDKRGQ
jgi:hypothetical protein